MTDSTRRPARVEDPEAPAPSAFEVVLTKTYRNFDTLVEGSYRRRFAVREPTGEPSSEARDEFVSAGDED